MRLKQCMTVDKIERTWFSDEKMFTVQTPTNMQNDRVPKNEMWHKLLKCVVNLLLLTEENDHLCFDRIYIMERILAISSRACFMRRYTASDASA